MRVTRLPSEAMALFRGRQESFVAERDALVERLRDEDRAADAAAVKALRKPTVVVWALNQLAVADAGGVQTLLDAGAELRAAQQAALSSSKGSADRMRTAAADRRAAVASLMASATSVIEEAGKSAGPQAEAMASALETASVDAETGRALAGGTLERLPAEPAGFGNVFGLSAVEAAPLDEDSEPEKGPAPDPGEIAGARRERDRTARIARTAKDTAEGFTRELEGMRERIAKVEAKQADADDRANRATTEAKRAERALAKAIARADRARGSPKR